MIGTVYFWIFALLAVTCGTLLLFVRHPLSGAMALVGAMISLSGIYSLLASPFLATLQILVYAGAIMMLVIFVIMVLNAAKEHRVPRFDVLGVVALVPAAALGGVAVRIASAARLENDPLAPRGAVEALATKLFETRASSQGWYLLFEVVGLVLIAAIVGAVLLVKRKLDEPVQVSPASGGH